MQDILNVLMKRLIKPDVLEGKTTSELIKVDVSKQDQQLPINKIDFGKEAENYLPQLKEGQRPDARCSMRDSYVNVIQYLQKNLPLNSRMLKDVTCLSPLMRSCNWSVDAIGRLASLIPHLISEREVSIVKDQWRLYQLEEIDENWIKDPKTGKMCRIDFYWSKIFNFMSSNGERKYTFLSKVVKSFLSIPNGNASAERSLSDNKNTLTHERTNLKKETLVALRRAKEFARNLGGAHKVYTHRKDVIKAVQESHAKNVERLRKEEEEKNKLEKLEKDKIEEQNRIALELEKAEKRKEILDKKEDQLKTDEAKLEKEYDVTMRMLKSTQAQMDEAIANGDMVGIQVSRELLEAATKKLETTSEHREAQNMIRVDVGKKRKIAFNKLFKTAKKKK